MKNCVTPSYKEAIPPTNLKFDKMLRIKIQSVIIIKKIYNNLK